MFFLVMSNHQRMEEKSMCQRQFANVRKRRRNIAVFRRGCGNKIKRFLAQKES